MQRININKQKLSKKARKSLPFDFVKQISEQKGISKRHVRNIISGRSRDLHGVLDMVVAMKKKYERKLQRISMHLK